MSTPANFWSVPAEELLRRLETTPRGLTGEEAAERLLVFGANRLKPKKRTDALSLLLAQFKSPIILILLFAAALSVFLRDAADAVIIFIIVLMSGLLGFWQEYGASSAVEKLLEIVKIKATALRDGGAQDVPVEEIVPGDIVELSAGGVIPGDCIILESKDFFVDEAALTGETYPAEKQAGTLPVETPLSRRSNSLFMGTHAVSGTARALVVGTGKSTEFGKVAERLKLRQPETDFERGVRRFGYFLMEVTLVLVIAIFAVNVLSARPVLDSFLFSLALAVGLTPQLLPAIISINLSHGARQMARKKVIVKRLASIENFGSMNILCSDKTGTLTEGMVRIHSALDIHGENSEKVLFHAYLNALHETGFANPIDVAIRSYRQFDVSGYKKLDEVPYDFIRKRLSVLLSKDGRHLMVTKGALEEVVSVCSSAEVSDGTYADIGEARAVIRRKFSEFSGRGFRTLGVACKALDSVSTITREQEAGMRFLGFLLFYDPPKPGVGETISGLEDLGISLKVITGDNKLVAYNVTTQVGLPDPKILTGEELHQTSDDALPSRVNEVDVFAEVEPNQKERIILALRKSGNVVGYMGDGINDASALHAADVGISVNEAVDVAKDAADIVLLEKDLGVLMEGVRGGRVTFANTLKYVFMATSANFGNMFSVAGASVFLPFLPMLPKQILLMNLITDLPEMTIATDKVDPEMIRQPRRWNIKFIRNFMVVFGSLSSVFDYATFGVLLFGLHAAKEQFRTGWFMESVISASAVVLVIRSRHPFFESRPGKYLALATPAAAALTLIIPFTPIGGLFGFAPISFGFLLVVFVLVSAYVLSAEMTKKIFWRRARV